MSIWSRLFGKRQPPAPVHKNVIRYASAQATRFSEGFASGPESNHGLIRNKVVKMRARSREMSRDNPHFKRFLKLMDTNVVGDTGIMFQSKVVTSSNKPDVAAITAIEKHQKIFAKSIDIRGEANLRDGTSQVLRHIIVDGEIFIRFHYDSRYKYNFAVEFLQADCCPVELNTTTAGGAEIATGIELDAMGRKVAYYFRTESRGSESHVYGNTSYIRVPAIDVLHVYDKEFSDQLRGVPWGQVIMETAHQINGYVSAAVIAQRVAASQMGWFETKNPAEDDVEFTGDRGGDDDGGGGTDEDDPDFAMDAEPGVFRNVPRNKKLVCWTPNITAQSYESMSKAMLRGLASGLNGPTYNSLAMDYSDVNYSSLRIAAIDEREAYKVVQQFLVTKFVEPLTTRWLEVAHLAQAISVNGNPLRKSIDVYMEFEFQPRRWLGVDPLKDSMADDKNITLRLASRSSIIRDSGRDPETVFKEIAYEEQFIKGLKIELSLPTNVQTSDKSKDSPGDKKEPSGTGDAKGDTGDTVSDQPGNKDN